MTFPYKIKVDRCIGSCNDKDNSYFRVCLPLDDVKNVGVKVFGLLSRENVLKNISFHESFKRNCLLNSSVCNTDQKWNKGKCRCE